MSYGDIIAIAIIVMSVLIISAIVLSKGIVIERRWGLLAVLILIVNAAIVPMANKLPLYTIAIIALSPIIISALKMQKQLKVVLFSIASILSVVIFCLYGWVNSNSNLYSTNPASDSYNVGLIESKRIETVIKYLGKYRSDERHYNEGWMLDSPLIDHFPDTCTDRLFTFTTTQYIYCWHTPLTGMYLVYSKPVELWHGSGRIEDILTTISFRTVSSKRLSESGVK